MIVGSAGLFAIEWDETVFVNGLWLAKFRYWIGECPIGEFEDTIVLTQATGNLRDFLKRTSVRHSVEFKGKDAADVFERTYCKVYGSSGLTQVENRFSSGLHQPTHDDWNDELAHACLLSPLVDNVADTGILVIVCDEFEKSERAIWLAEGSCEFDEFKLPCNAVDDAIQQFLVGTRDLVEQVQGYE